MSDVSLVERLRSLVEQWKRRPNDGIGYFGALDIEEAANRIEFFEAQGREL